jgi:hypothetical protein
MKKIGKNGSRTGTATAKNGQNKEVKVETNAKGNETAANGSGVQKEGNLSTNVMSGPEVAALTAETVTSLNKMAGEEVFAWVQMGKLVHEYVEKVSPNGGKEKHDPYIALAKHEGSALRAGQLRNYEACYVLYKEFDGTTEAPGLALTFYIVVLGKHLTIEKKRDLLNQAKKDSLSVSGLRALVSKTVTKGEAESDSIATAWNVKKVQGRAKALYDVLVGINNKVDDEHTTIPDAVRNDVREFLVPVLQYAIAHGLLSVKDIALTEISQVKTPIEPVAKAA